MNIKITLLCLFVIFSIGTISAAEVTYDDESAPCYACNSSDCNCSNSCLCKNHDYKTITKNDNKIRNNEGCYYCNESCNCVDSCSCKHLRETSNTSSSENTILNWWNNFINYLKNITHTNNNTNEHITNNTTEFNNTTNNNTTELNDTIDIQNTSEDTDTETTEDSSSSSYSENSEISSSSSSYSNSPA
ncbi:hypothetical protein [Methanosphaera sp. WGK6]|uniref:hypothetical protein n=1 Tax=Methanosphaera sp. WGK6 TaxID=1561964 RepID=UPI00084CCADC|nr:hypothetical protein [Methanosphaera sp. WGK6]OED30814.1 hypothetical protein NL43_00405 [Methanosphaera sp. WGK6]